MKKNRDIEYEVKFTQTLKRNPHKGLFIAFEGIDGAGKSVQVAHLDEYLKSVGKSTVVTFQPRRDGPVGALINDILQKKVKVPAASLQYLYTADRIIDHLERIEPALESGKIVLSHRCMWSNLPYGLLDEHIVDYDSNEARVIDVAHGLLSLYHQFTVPDITFYLRVTAEEAIARLERKHEGLELYEKKDKMEKVSKGYEWQVKQFPNEFVIINGEQSEERVADEVKSYMEKALK